VLNAARFASAGRALRFAQRLWRFASGGQCSLIFVLNAYGDSLWLAKRRADFASRWPGFDYGEP